MKLEFKSRQFGPRGQDEQVRDKMWELCESQDEVEVVVRSGDEEHIVSRGIISGMEENYRPEYKGQRAQFTILGFVEEVK